ncbi:MAG: hypothetical protein JNM78_02805 [Cyclobacteriaceae bacterium]|nr:hypothetical protein [Cyclobacteriaceae bacterium]
MSAPSKHILVAVLDWGLGHATRSIVVINALLEKGCSVSIAGNGQSLELLKQEYPQLNFHELQSYDVLYSNGRPFILNIFLQLPKFLKAIRLENKQVEELIDKNKFDAVISDNRYGCWSKEIPSVLITHQLNLQMPVYFSWLSGFINYFNHRQIRKFTECWVPDFVLNPITGRLTSTENLSVRFIGMLSRFNPKKIEENDNLIMGVVSGPEPQRSVFEELLVNEMEKQTRDCIIVRGTPKDEERRHSRIKFVNHLHTNELKELIQKAGIIVSRSGYSTIMDLSVLGKKQIIFIPTPGQTEQEYLAEQLRDRKIALIQKQAEFNLTKAMTDVKGYNGFTQVIQEVSMLHSAIDDLIMMIK